MVFAVMTVSPALAILSGPIYPPPGGVSWAPSGTDPGDPNGLNWNYTGFNFAAGDISNLYWAPLQSTIGISLDNGQSYAGGEILQLSADPNGASAQWSGIALLTYKLDTNDPWTYNEVVETRYTVTLSGNASWISPGSLPSELEGDNGAVARITGDFTANLFAEAKFPPDYVWMPINEGFNALETLGSTGSSFQSGFWSEPYTGFTYQGRLLADNVAADGVYDMQFMLYDDPNTLAGNQMGSTILADDIEVINGYFIAELDFGTNAFDSRARWLQIAVRPGESSDPNNFVTLSPPQPLTTTPYALNSLQTRGISVGPTMNVGIGTTSPTEKLEVNGTVKATAFIGNITGIETDPTVNESVKDGVDWTEVTGIPGDIADGDDVGDSDWIVSGNNMYSAVSGNVGIGTDSPASILDIQQDASMPIIKLTNTNTTSGHVGMVLHRGDPNAECSLTFEQEGANVWKIGMDNAPAGTEDDFIIKKTNNAAAEFTIKRDTGNVGIGTTDPNRMLHLSGPIPEMQFTDTDGTKEWHIGARGDDFLITETDEAIRMCVKTGGNVGIGTTDPNATLDVKGTVMAIAFSGDGSGLTNLPTNSLWVPNGADIYYSSGNIGIGTTSPTTELEVNGTVKANNFKGVPWRSPQWHMNEVSDAADIGWLCPDVGWQMYKFSLPFDVTIEGCVISADDEANGSSISLSLYVDQETTASRTTSSTTLADWESKTITFSGGPIDVSAGSWIMIKGASGNNLVEIACWLYGRYNE